MKIIHFTHNATDRLDTHDAIGVDFVPLADGRGETHISCAHLEPGAQINAPSMTHASALLVVHGRINITSREGQTVNINIHSGMGAVFDKDQPYAFRSITGAIVLIVECDELKPHARGISTPQRITGATWPSDILLV